MDITTFMTWFVSQCVRIFTYTYTTLDNIQFAGTSVLRIIIMTSILSALIGVVLTIPYTIGAYGMNQYEEIKAHNKEVKERNKKNDNE